MHIRLQGICKRFGDTLANDNVDLDVVSGRVTALLGENGAGKSTLMKILYGFQRPDGGTCLIDGIPREIRSPRDAIALHIGMVFQQFSLIPALTVRENLALAHPHTPWWLGHHARRFADPVARLHHMASEIDPDKPVSQLAVGAMQLVELVKVLNLEAKVVILDEPTSVLTPSEAERLWQQIRAIAQSGVAVVLITHKLEDVFACAHDVVVMRRGRVVATMSTQATSADQLVRLIVGEHEVPQAHAISAPTQAIERVRVRALSAVGPHGAVRDIDLSLVRGEIVGVAGVSGNGQQTLADAVAGLIKLEAGEVIVDGETVRAPRMRQRSDARVAYLPEQPLRNGLAPDLNLAVNLWLKKIRQLPFFPDYKRLHMQADEMLRQFDVRPAVSRTTTETLSGGNLQKLVAARELNAHPVLVLACYPAMGLDMAASAAVYDALFSHARKGACVLWISEDLDDLMRYAHRIVVMHGGRIVGNVPASETTRRQLAAWMVGQESESVHA